MLYSPSADIGFAHYPKTAGHSLCRWFREVFPDATFVEPHPHYAISHLSVRESLHRLGLVPRPRTGGRLRKLGHWIPGLCRAGTVAPCATRIIGVLRDPFEMLVSLFEYWRSFDFREPPTLPLIRCARSGSFVDFLEMAVVERQLPNYHDFFDIDGPTAATLRLLDFRSLEAALREVCHEFGLPTASPALPILNAGPKRRPSLDRYREEAGALLRAVETHFRWYYREGIRTMVDGQGQTAARRRTAAHPARTFPAWSRAPAEDRGWLTAIVLRNSVWRNLAKP